MYYLVMKTAVKPYLKSTTFCISKSYTRLKEKETYLGDIIISFDYMNKPKDLNTYDFKFYQKLFVLLISFSTILIFPESPRILGNICEIYNSRKTCNVF